MKNTKGSCLLYIRMEKVDAQVNFLKAYRGKRIKIKVL